MKKLALLAMLAIAASVSSAEVITNQVVIVSNIYNQVFSEHVVTQKIQSTHYEYYFTNNVYWVTNVTRLVSQTNQTVYLDVGKSYLLAASNQANRAEAAVGSAQSVVGQAVQSANAAASSASAASSSAASASATRNAAANECASALATINARINWFDEHSGETITQVNSNITINVNAQDYSFTYTNAAGVAYGYVTVHPYGQNGGVTVSARSSSAYSTVAIRAWPRPRESGWWDFYPAYVDYDEKGMRLQYVPDTTVPIKYSGGEGVYPNGWIVPEYFYWQSGYIYMKVRVWENGSVVAWCITRYSWANWPNTIGYGGDNGTWMELVDRQGYGSSSMLTSQLAAFYSKTRTASTGQSIEFPMQASSSYASTLQWMREGPKFTDLESKVDALSAQWTQVSAAWNQTSADWTSFRAAVSSGISDLSNRVESVESGNPRVYVDSAGVSYPNITAYGADVPNGRVSVTTVGNFYPSSKYRVYPEGGGGYTSSSTAWWTFSPAYVDSDMNGMRLHYLPDQMRTISSTYSSDKGCVYVPRDFYWQGGVLYFVMDSFKSGVWMGRVVSKYAGTGNYVYPSSIYGTSSDNTTSYYVNMVYSSHEGTILGAPLNRTAYCHLKTANGSNMPSYDSLLWFPSSPTAEQKNVLDWLATFVK